MRILLSNAENIQDLINNLRDAFDMHGVPIRLFVRQGKNPYADKADGARKPQGKGPYRGKPIKKG